MIFRKLDNWFSNLLTLINSLSALITFAVMLIITFDVLSRVLFNAPIQGVAEIVGNVLVILCFMQIPFVLMKGRHLRSTVLYDRMGFKGKNIADLLACLLGMLVFLLIMNAGWTSFLRAWAISEGEMAGTLRIPTSPGRFAIVFGSALMAIEFFILAVKHILNLVIKQSEATGSETPANEMPKEGDR
ncbi:MAG: TRAP transporter small permease [Defluviitaleaceae bacterium]|nr:TRAP transporter small permease [Defluviitaleaceae bacterium]